MENQRNLFAISLVAISAILYFKWLDFIKPEETQTPTQIEQSADLNSIPTATGSTSIAAAPVNGAGVPSLQAKPAVTDPAQLITVNTDLVIATINTKGGVIDIKYL